MQETMIDYKQKIFQELSRLTKGLGSEKRLDILNILSQGPKTVEGIAHATGLSVANTSRHLQVLKESHLVVTSRNGNFIRYSLASEKVVQLVLLLFAVGEEQLAEVRAIESDYDEGEAGDNAGILLRGINREDIERGQVIAKPGTITPHTEFKCKVYILTKEEGGRHTPFSQGYKPQFYFRTTDVTGEVELPKGKEMVMPGDNVEFDVKLQAAIAMEKGLTFAIREGGRTVGAGQVTEIIK